MSDDEKVRENRLRREAARQGLRLEKSRRRDERALDYGTYSLIDEATNSMASQEGLDLDDVEHYLARATTREMTKRNLERRAAELEREHAMAKTTGGNILMAMAIESQLKSVRDKLRVIDPTSGYL